jgi:hypothetical protein
VLPIHLRAQVLIEKSRAGSRDTLAQTILPSRPLSKKSWAAGKRGLGENALSALAFVERDRGGGKHRQGNFDGGANDTEYFYFFFSVHHAPGQDRNSS